jgi:hypothetical protein
MEDEVPVLLVLKLILHLFHGVDLTPDDSQLILSRCVGTLYSWISAELTESIVNSGDVDNTKLSIST